MSKVTSMLNESGKVFEIMLGLGLFGLMFLVVFGNLSGNLGFSSDTITNSVNNETNYANPVHANTTGYLLSGFNSSWSQITIIQVLNSSGDGGGDGGYNTSVATTEVTPSVLGVLTNATNDEYWNITVSYTYVHSFDSQGIRDTDSVITNLTGGTTTFFGFANIWFTLLAVTVLIVIILGVIGFVRGRGSGGSTGSGRNQKMRSGGFTG